MPRETYLTHYIKQGADWIKVAEYALPDAAGVARCVTALQECHPADTLRFEVRGANARDAWAALVSIAARGKSWHTRSGIGAGRNVAIDAFVGDRCIGASWEDRHNRGDATIEPINDGGITRPGYEASEAEIAYAVHGFNLIGTGGNCTAFYKPLDAEGARHILITLLEDAEAPQSSQDNVRVGLYGGEHSEELDGFDAENLREAIATIAAKNWR